MSSGIHNGGQMELSNVLYYDTPPHMVVQAGGYVNMVSNWISFKH